MTCGRENHFVTFVQRKIASEKKRKRREKNEKEEKKTNRCDSFMQSALSQAILIRTNIGHTQSAWISIITFFLFLSLQFTYCELLAHCDAINKQPSIVNRIARAYIFIYRQNEFNVRRPVEKHNSKLSSTHFHFESRDTIGYCNVWFSADLIVCLGTGNRQCTLLLCSLRSTSLSISLVPNQSFFEQAILHFVCVNKLYCALCRCKFSILSILS